MLAASRSLLGVLFCLVWVTLGDDVPVMPCRDGTKETVPCTIVCDTIKDCANGADEDPAICYDYPDLVHVPECFVAPGPFSVGIIVAWGVFILTLLVVCTYTLAARRDTSNSSEPVRTCGLTMPSQHTDVVQEDATSSACDTCTRDEGDDTRDGAVSLSAADVETDTGSEGDHGDANTFETKTVYQFSCPQVINNFMYQFGTYNDIKLHDDEQCSEGIGKEDEVLDEQETSVGHSTDALDSDCAANDTL